MEEVKVLNEKFAHEGVVYGETSRSDMLEEEKMVDVAPLAVPPGMKNTRATSSYPQPKLAKDHTEANVCFKSFHLSSIRLFQFCVTSCDRCQLSSTGSMLVV